MKVLSTGISRVHWCDPETGYKTANASIPRFHNRREAPTPEHRQQWPLSWLDRLFEGGIIVPTEGSRKRALTVLLTGSPGTGKTTLAAELCLRWATEALCLDTETWQAEKLRALYVTTEAYEPWMIANVHNLGWTSGVFKEARNYDAPPAVYLLRVDPKSYTRAATSKRGHPTSQTHGAGLLPAVNRFFGARGNGPPSGGSKKAQLVVPSRLIEEHKPHVVVADSLNTLASDDQADLFQRFIGLAESGPLLLIMVLDSAPTTDRAAFWEYASDVVVRLDASQDHGYLVRTIEIVKARYQSHVWGKHQLKLYEMPRQQEDPVLRMRAHPYIEVGGVFVFPSIHSHLSEYKRHGPQLAPKYLQSHLVGLNTMLRSEGYPVGRCTALVGSRGAHKSRLGYLEILAKVLRNDPTYDYRALIVSLRDDEGVTRSDLCGVLTQARQQQAQDSSVGHADDPLRMLQDQDKLEIMYFPPGYITPDEFFHRVLLSISRFKHKLKAKDSCEQRILLLFNSIDQLSSRFPLCAHEAMFVPGLIAMLSAEEVTSFFVAASEGMDTRMGAGDPGAGKRGVHAMSATNVGYGLDSVAELILNFEREHLFQRDYLQRVSSIEQGRFRAAPKAPHWTVKVQVDRFAGGTSAGAYGYLDLIGNEHPLLTSNVARHGDLYFLPWVS